MRTPRLVPDTAALPWQEFLIPGSNLPALYQLLNRDEATGAPTFLVEEPAGWRRSTIGYYDIDEELFYLDGGSNADGHDYRRFSYVFRPAETVHHPAFVADGARIINFFPAWPTFVPSETSGPRFDARRAIPHASPDAWNRTRTARGTTRALLRDEPALGESLWVERFAAGWQGSHELGAVEMEAFVLEGPLQIDGATLVAGGYQCRAPGRHSAIEAIDEALLLVRTTAAR